MVETFVAPNALPFECWTSPISAANLDKGAIGVWDLKVADGRLYWLENLPNEGGRSVVKTAKAGQLRRMSRNALDSTAHSIILKSLPRNPA
jgi:hypothetical protein